MFPCLSTVAQDLGKEQKQQTAIPSHVLSDFDFPTLEAGVNLTKEQKKKSKDVSSNVSNAPVFRDAYHAQLREVHGANMRAVEAMENDEENLAVKWRRVAINPDRVNGLVEDVIREIAAKGELVTKEKV